MMNKNFQSKLSAIYHNRVDSNRFNKDFPEDELKKIIRYGAMGEAGPNYYLFLYRDFYRPTPFYGAIIFLDKRDLLDYPVTITAYEMDGQQRVRNIFVKAALFFLENQFQDTMAVAGAAKPVFDLARETINDFIASQTTLVLHTKDPLEEFQGVPANLEKTVKATLVPLPKAKDKSSSSRLSVTPGLEDHLALLHHHTCRLQADAPGSALPVQVDDDCDTISSTEPTMLDAKPAFNFKWQVLDLSGEKYPYLQPILQLKYANGSFSKPQTIPNSGLAYVNLVMNEQESQEFKGIGDTFNHLAFIDSQPGNLRFKLKLMKELYFPQLAQWVFQNPSSHKLPLFHQPQNQSKEFLPLTPLLFTRLHLRFAPSLASLRHYSLHYYLSFDDEQGNHYEAKDNYSIILTRFQERFRAYLFFQCTEGNYFLAAPKIQEVPASQSSQPQNETSPFYALLEFIYNQHECRLSDFDEIFAALKQLASPHIIIQETPLRKYQMSLTPSPILKIFPPDLDSQSQDHQDRLVLHFDYQTHIDAYIAKHPDKMVCTYVQDEEFETLCNDILKADPLLVPRVDLHQKDKSLYHFYQFKGGDMIQWLTERGNLYLEKGFKIFSVKWQNYIGSSGSQLKLNISSDIQWLQFKPVIIDPVSGKELPIHVENVDLSTNSVQDKSGKLYLLKPKDIQRIARLHGYARQQGEFYKIPSANFVLIRYLYDQKMEEFQEIRDTLALEQQLKRLEAFDSIPDYPLPKEFNGTLRSYQQDGFKWLRFLQDYRFSGCLADDMGLGKTVQTLALLQALKSEDKLRTSLLIVPVSAIPNWESEINTFAPNLTFHRHIGANRDKETTGWNRFDLIISSYATIRNDVEQLLSFSFDYIILDESQNIKNPTALTTKAIKLLKADNRLALSGTPIENNTLELWSLFDFLLPGFLGTHKYFAKQFAAPIEKDNDSEKADLLRKMIYPFILRRRKQDVEAQLPEKTEIVTKLRMEPDQYNLYAETAARYRGELEQQLDEKGVSGSSMKILEGMLRLRQICLFPQLADKDLDTVSSAKFLHLQEILEDILSEGHKVLIFSQFVEALRLIRTYCDSSEINYSYIDGSVSLNNREKTVADFQQNPDTRVFLLSLKAGGVALNLTAADYVIIFDPWWNPAVEAQAIDRSHRIGQTKKVMVYRMVVENTIEEKMLALQSQKKELVQNLIATDSQSFKNLSREDVLNLFC